MPREIAAPLKQTIINIVSKLEGLNDQKQEVLDEISDQFKKAKIIGLDLKVLREILSTRKKNQPDLFAHQQLVQLYKEALGMVDGEKCPAIRDDGSKPITKFDPSKARNISDGDKKGSNVTPIKKKISKPKKDKKEKKDKKPTGNDDAANSKEA